MVDALWREYFPGVSDVCPLFDHWDAPYRRSESYFPGDVCTVADVPKAHWKTPGEVVPAIMLACEYWNGCNHQKTDFDGNVYNGITRLVQEHREGKYPAKNVDIRDDWLVVTVDYHN